MFQDPDAVDDDASPSSHQQKGVAAGGRG